MQSATHDAEAKLAAYKDSAVNSISRTKASAEQEAEWAKAKTKAEAEKAKASSQGWFSWLWGSTKKEASDAESKAAQKVAEGAGDVKKSAEKRI